MKYFRLGVLILLSAVAAFPQVNPVPAINGPVSPRAVTPGASDFSMTVRGAGFVPGAVVNWNGIPLVTTFVSKAELQAQVPAADTIQPGSALITVTNPPPGGGLSSSSFGNIEIHEPTTKTVFGHPLLYGVAEGGVGSVAVDLNGDGRLDLVQANSGIEILLGNGDGTFARSASLKLSPLSIPTGFSFGDFNGDGKEDFVYVDHNGTQAFVCLGTGNGKFQAMPGFGNFDTPGNTAVGDFNRDGILDLVVVSNGEFDLLLGNGDGTFQTQQTNTSVSQPTEIIAADLDRDGILDLVFLNHLSEVDVLLGNGNGTFQPPSATQTGTTEGALLIDDFNGDGNLDFVLEPSGNPWRLETLLGNGNGTLQSPQDSFTGFVNSLPLFTVGDFNSDGEADLIAYRINDSSVASLLLGNSDGTFQPPTRLRLPGRVVERVTGIVGDFNSDGLLDFGVGVGGTEIFLQTPQ
jgi:hypothetical protein